MTDTKVIEDIVDILANKLNYDAAYDTRCLLHDEIIKRLNVDEKGMVHVDISWLIGLFLRLAKR